MRAIDGAFREDKRLYARGRSSPLRSLIPQVSPKGVSTRREDFLGPASGANRPCEGISWRLDVREGIAQPNAKRSLWSYEKFVGEAADAVLFSRHRLELVCRPSRKCRPRREVSLWHWNSRRPRSPTRERYRLFILAMGKTVLLLLPCTLMIGKIGRLR